MCAVTHACKRGMCWRWVRLSTYFQTIRTLLLHAYTLPTNQSQAQQHWWTPHANLYIAMQHRKYQVRLYTLPQTAFHGKHMMEALAHDC